MILTYRLNEAHEPVPEPDILAWEAWMESPAHIVAQDEAAGVLVSTVCLGLRMNLLDSGLPTLFETMVFGGTFDQCQERYATWADAEAGHWRWLAKVFGGSDHDQA